MRIGVAYNEKTVVFNIDGPTVDFQDALESQDFHANPCEISVGPRGSVKRHVENWRRNGKTQTWKTREGEFRVPVKYGLKKCGEITLGNADSVHSADKCPLDKLTDEKVRELAEKYRKVIDSVHPEHRVAILEELRGLL